MRIPYVTSRFGRLLGYFRACQFRARDVFAKEQACRCGPQGFALRGRVHGDWDEYAEHTIFFARRLATGIFFAGSIYLCGNYGFVARA